MPTILIFLPTLRRNEVDRLRRRPYAEGVAAARRAVLRHQVLLLIAILHHQHKGAEVLWHYVLAPVLGVVLDLNTKSELKNHQKNLFPSYILPHAHGHRQLNEHVTEEVRIGTQRRHLVAPRAVKGNHQTRGVSHWWKKTKKSSSYKTHKKCPPNTYTSTSLPSD